jgi:WD40 repeat protein
VAEPSLSGAASIAPDDGLLGLHGRLARAGFVAGPVELLAAARLLLRLREAGAWRDDLAALGPMLRAVYAKSAAEQRGFDAVYAQWAGEQAKAAARARPDVPATTETAPPAPPAEPYWKRWWRHGAQWLVLLAAAAIVLVAIYRDRRSSEAPVPPLPAASQVAPPAPTASAPTPSRVGKFEPATAEGLTGFGAPHRVQREFRPWVVALLLLLPLPLLLFLYAPALVFSRRPSERARSASAVTLDVSSWRLEAERIVPAMDLRTAARLDRHVLPRFDDPWVAGRRRLDLPRSLAATQRRHGRFTLVWRPPRARPSYLVLIDTRDEHDLRGRLFFRWADRMRREGVGVEIWLFVDDPRRLHPADQRHVLDAQGKMRNPVRFEQVAARAARGPGARLIVVGDGDSMFARDAELHDWWRDLAWWRWKERVWFTPRDSRDWGEREVAIERALVRGDPGFLVLPLEQEALDAWAVQLTAGTLPTIVLASARRFPPPTDQLPRQGLGDEPPADDLVEKLVAQLRLYLGENGLRWLAAVALPPIVRWELTLLIGQELFNEMGAGDETALRWLMQTHYPRLARLPWLRNARMPDWLALRLLHELSPAAQQRVRRALTSLFERVPAEDAAAGADRLTLDFAAPGGPRGGAAATADAPADPERRRRQWLYLGFMDGLTPRELALRAPDAWRHLFARLPPRRALGRGLRAAAQLAAEALRALLARLMWREGQAGGGASPWPLLISAGWLLAVGTLLAVAARMPPGQMWPAVEQALLHEVRLDRGFVADARPAELSFSADGRRFAIAYEGGRVEVRAVDADATLVGPPIELGRAPLGLWLDAQGQSLLALGRDGSVTTRRVDTGARRGIDIDAGPVPNNPLTAFDGIRLAIKRDDGNVALIVLGGRTDIVPTGPINEMALSASELVWTATGEVGTTIGRVSLADPTRPTTERPPLLETELRSWLDSRGRFVVVVEPGTLFLYRLQDLSQPAFEARIDDANPRILFSENLVLAVGVQGGTAWRLSDGSSAVSFLGSARRAQVAAGSDVLVAIFEDGRMRGFDLSPALALVTPLPGDDQAQDKRVIDVAVAPRAAAVLTATEGDGALRIEPALRLYADTPMALGNLGRIDTLAVSADGSRAAAGTDSGEIVVWSPGRSTTPQRWKGQGAALRSLQFSEDGTRLLSAAADGAVGHWNAELGTELARPPQLGEASRGVRADRELRRVLAFDNGRARRFDLFPGDGANSADTRAVNVAEGLADAQIDPVDGRTLIARASPPEIAVWNLSGGLQRSASALLRARTAPTPTAPAAPPAPRCDKGVVPRNAFAGDPLCVAPARREQVAQDNAQRSARVSPTDRTYGPETCEQGYVWREADRPLRGDAFTDRACVTPAERNRAAVEGRQLTDRRAQSTAQLAPPTNLTVDAPPSEPIRALRIGSIGSRPVIALGDSLARPFDSISLEPIGPAVSHPGLSDAAWIDDVDAGISFVTAGADGAVRLWDAASGNSAGAPLLHGAEVRRIAVSANGRRLASVDANGAVRLWNLRAGRPVPGAPAARIGAAETPFALSADGLRLVTLTESGAPASWNLPASTSAGERRSVRIAPSVWLGLLAAAGAAALARRFGAAIAAAA